MPSKLLRKLEGLIPLSEAERRALEGLAAHARTRSFRPREDIVPEGDRPTECSLILDGFACRYKLLADGKRQIMSFQLAGDITDLHAFLLGELDHGIGALTPCKVAMLPHDTLQEVAQEHPRIAQALWRDTLIDGAVFREWMIGIGRRSARGRIAHLLCEVLTRLKAVGLAEELSCELPITQSDLGDALGLSVVHVNRVLQELRGEGLITLRGKLLVVNDWTGLEAAGQFDPSYLFPPTVRRASGAGRDVRHADLRPFAPSLGVGGAAERQP
jgi:CRP-like cAMP-binding protein